MCMVLYYLINDTINKLLMMMTRKRGKSAARGGAAAAKLDLFWAKADPFFRRKTTVRINEENWWHYDPSSLYPFFEGLLELTSFQNSPSGGFLCGGKKAANLSICWLLQRHTSLSQFTTFFFHVWKNDIKNNSYNNFRRIEHKKAALFFLRGGEPLFAINLPGAPFSKRCVAVPSFWNVDCILIRVEQTMYFHVISEPKRDRM